MKLLKALVLRLLRKPAPHFVTNAILGLVYGARIDLAARIFYPLNFRLSRRVRIGAATIECHPWLGVVTPTILVGEDSAIADQAMLIAMDGVLSLGRECTVNPYAVLYSAGNLTIGDYSRIAAHVVIIPENHVFDSRDKPICKQGASRKGVVLEGDVWLGAGVRVLDGVTIGKGAVVGAGAVVTRNVAGYTVVAGVPAVKIGER